MRSLTDKDVIKHVGNVRDFRTWWEELLAQVELVADDLFEFIRDAQEIDLDFSELPFTVTEFYNLLGFPDYLEERAAEDAEANAASPFAIDMWTLHSGATYVLTYFFQGKERPSTSTSALRTTFCSTPRVPSRGLNRRTSSSWMPRTMMGRNPRSPASGHSRASNG